MDDSNNSGAIRNRRLLLAAIATLALVIGAVAYRNSRSRQIAHQRPEQPRAEPGALLRHPIT
jgi:hypothetical protein